MLDHCPGTNFTMWMRAGFKLVCCVAYYASCVTIHIVLGDICRSGICLSLHYFYPLITLVSFKDSVVVVPHYTLRCLA